MLLLAAELAVIWAFSAYAYGTLPERVVTHFNASGTPDARGSRSMFLLMPVAFSIAPVIILLAVSLRFRLINDYPYLVNLPAFFADVWALPPGRHPAWVNRYFDRVLALGTGLTLFLLVLLLFIYRGTVEERLPSWFLAFTLTFPVLLVVLFLASLQRLSREVRAERAAGTPPTPGT